MKAQLTLRDLFWLVLVCALLVMWWRAEQRANDEAETVKAIAHEMETQLQALADEQMKAGDGTEYSGFKVEVIRD